MRPRQRPHPRELRAVEIIGKKRDGLRVEPEELDCLVGEYVAGRVAEEEMAAFLIPGKK